MVLSATARGIKETGGQCFDKVESLAASFDAVVRASRTDMAVLTEQVKKLSERGGVPAASSDAVTPQTQSGAAGAAGQVAGTQRSGKEVVPLAPWGAAIQDKITDEYIKQWASGRTKDEVFPSNYDVTSIMAGVCQRNFKVDRASANRITMSKFTFPSRINPLVTADEYFTTYMKRNIATWHSKCKDLLFEAYLKRLVVDGEYGCTVIKQGKRTVALSAAHAIELLTNDSFYTLDSCFTAFVSSIFSFVVTVPNGDRLIVPRSATVPEAFVRLLNAHLGWFILKLRMELTAVAGLPQLVKRGTNADEGMRKLWAVDCLQAAEFMAVHGSNLYRRVVITDGNDPERASVGGYDVEVVKELRGRILLRSAPGASSDAGASAAATRDVPDTEPVALVEGVPAPSGLLAGAAASPAPVGAADLSASASPRGPAAGMVGDGGAAGTPAPVLLAADGVQLGQPEPRGEDSLDMSALSFQP